MRSGGLVLANIQGNDKSKLMERRLLERQYLTPTVTGSVLSEKLPRI